MTPEQEIHLERIKREFCALVEPKYRKGQAEHGGNLWDCSTETLLDFAIAEAIDQVVYLLTLEEALGLPARLKVAQGQDGRGNAKERYPKRSVGDSGACQECGILLQDRMRRGKARKFCSVGCRKRAWLRAKGVATRLENLQEAGKL